MLHENQIRSENGDDLIGDDPVGGGTPSGMSAAWHSGLEHHFYDDHDRKVNGSTPNLVWLLRS